MTCNCASASEGGLSQVRHGGHTLAELAALTNGSPPTNADTVVTGVHDDSRTVDPGCLYLALPGRNVHGVDFEVQAQERGAVAMLSDRPGAILPTIVVPDPRAAAGPVSAHVYGHPSVAMNVYGITGTNGKTSTTYLLDAALTAAGEHVGTTTGIALAGPHSTLPSLRTTPEAAALQRTLARFRDEGATSVAVEVSSHAVTQQRVDGTQFVAMGFTNLGKDHLDFHGSMEEYFSAKAQMFQPGRTAAAAVGIDDEYGRRLAASTRVPCWTWSMFDPRADVVAESLECTAAGTRFTARTPSGRFDVRLRLLGPHQARNAMTALALLAANGVDQAAAVDGFARVETVPGRLEPIDEGQPFTALVDYMHNTAGQRRLLPYLRSLTEGRVIAVIGATGDRDRSKRFPLGATAATFADVVIITDESPYSEDAAAIRKAVAAGATAAKSATVVVEPDRRTAFALAVTEASRGDVVVVTGRGCDDRFVEGGVTTWFDDRAELRRALRGR